jgi:hypothetical protein
MRSYVDPPHINHDRAQKVGAKQAGHGAGEVIGPAGSIAQLRKMLEGSPRSAAMMRLAATLQRRAAPTDAPTDTVADPARAFRSAELIRSRDNGRPHPPDVVQLATYAARKPVEGINMVVRVVDNEGGLIQIEDLTKTASPVGKLTGYITYSSDKSELVLNHFEAAPGGLGLGSLLMYALAYRALKGKFKIIPVATPALSAMGAYQQFGGRAGDPMQFAELFKLYFNAMKADPRVHARFVKEEADAMGDAAVAREHYFNPKVGPVGEGNVYLDAFRTHTREHPATSDVELARAAELKAMSASLVYDPTELLKKSHDMLARKWELVG